MGRKIPAKKHRGVKDPHEQQARRLQSLKGKINAPPAAPDEQPVPRSLTRLFAVPAARTPRAPRRPRPAPNPVAALRRLPAEPGRAFALRISAAARALSAPPAAYPVEAAEEEPAEARAERRAERRARRRAAAPPAPAPGKARRLDLKKRAKQERADEEARAALELVYERVPFGATSAAPPALPAGRSPAGRRPGARPLLLSALLQRDAAVEAYRALKAARRDRTPRRDRAPRANTS